MVFLVLLPQLVFMLCLFGYLVFLIVYKWLAYGPGQSDRAPSILLHFINMLLFTDSEDSLPLHPGQVSHSYLCLKKHYSPLRPPTVSSLSPPTEDNPESSGCCGFSISSCIVAWETSLPVVPSQWSTNNSKNNPPCCSNVVTCLMTQWSSNVYQQVKDIPLL